MYYSFTVLSYWTEGRRPSSTGVLGTNGGTNEQRTKNLGAISAV